MLSKNDPRDHLSSQKGWLGSLLSETLLGVLLDQFDFVFGKRRIASYIRKEIKKRQDSVTSYTDGGRQDLADTEKAEIAVLEKYLPAAMSAEDLVQLVEATIAEIGATSRKDMGRVMKLLQERTAGAADNRILSAEVSKRLA